MYFIVKRISDVAISLIGLTLFAPIMVMVAVIIKLESKGPIIFKQERLGRYGKVFKMYKFRSMHLGAERGSVYVRKGDTRVTKVGKFIRKTSIDELPQFVNVLKGDMSIIGPRPTLEFHPWPFENYSNEQKVMFQVRPGITGWAQVNGRKTVDWTRRIELNVEYVNKMSMSFDFMILKKTIIKVFTMKDNESIGETTKNSNN